MGIRRNEGSFEGAAGRRLFRRSWLPEAPDRAVLLVHGFGEHCGRYEAMGSWLADRGCAVHGYDHRGHGRSEGPRNYIDAFDDYLDDLDVILEIVRVEHPGLELTIVGHSMGGLTVLAFLRERKPDVFAAVTSGPALEITALTGPKLWIAKALRRLRPHTLIDAGLPADALSRDPEVVRAYEDDPLVETRMTPSLGLEMMAATERTAAGGGEVGVPLLMLHGGGDPLCAAQGSQDFFESLPATARPPSRLEIYPGLLHEIFNEPEQEQIFEDLLGWVCGLESAARPARQSTSPA